jgi:predicted PurR-regulated permease PerM
MKNRNVVTILIFIILILFLGWKFANIVVYIFMAFVLAIIGAPLVQLLEKISIKGRKMPSGVAAGITLFVLIGVIGSALFFFIPFLLNELSGITSINPELFAGNIENWLHTLEEFLVKYGVLSPQDSLSVILTEQTSKLLESLDFQNIVGNLFSFAGSLFIALFSITFLTFFSLKDKQIFFKTLEKIIPVNYRENYGRILHNSKKPLTRYFVGVILDMTLVVFLEGFLCFLLGVPNPVLIGVIGGLLNIIPYIGPLLSTAIGVIITATALLPVSADGAILTQGIIKVLIAFGITNLIDNFVFQPLIYGKSVQAHPIEIFIVILVAGQVGGVVGMIFGVPIYTLLRIVIKEFFGHFYHVQNDPLPQAEEIEKE